MINYELLRNRIDKSGIKIYALAEACGLTPQGLYKKLSGKSDFRCTEIICISKALNLSNEDRNAIFFAPIVD
jgi:predicted transcriptional regulator